MSKVSKLIVSKSPEQTNAIGRRIGRFAPAGTVIAAYGELGSGKTCFAAGLGRGMGVDDLVVSPTYIFFRIYEGENDRNFAHIDAYRLEDLGEEEIALTGIEDCFARQNVVFVEWPGYIKVWLPEDTIRMQIERGADDNERLLEFVYDPVKQGWLNEAFSY